MIQCCPIKSSIYFFIFSPFRVQNFKHLILIITIELIIIILNNNNLMPFSSTSLFTLAFFLFFFSILTLEISYLVETLREDIYYCLWVPFKKSHEKGIHRCMVLSNCNEMRSQTFDFHTTLNITWL